MFADRHPKRRWIGVVVAGDRRLGRGVSMPTVVQSVREVLSDLRGRVLQHRLGGGPVGRVLTKRFK